MKKLKFNPALKIVITVVIICMSIQLISSLARASDTEAQEKCVKERGGEYQGGSRSIYTFKYCYSCDMLLMSTYQIESQNWPYNIEYHAIYTAQDVLHTVDFTECQAGNQNDSCIEDLLINDGTMVSPCNDYIDKVTTDAGHIWPSSTGESRWF